MSCRFSLSREKQINGPQSCEQEGCVFNGVHACVTSAPWWGEPILYFGGTRGERLRRKWFMGGGRHILLDHVGTSGPVVVKRLDQKILLVATCWCLDALSVGVLGSHSRG